MIDATRIPMTNQPTQDTPMTRELTDHIVNPANDNLKITVEDAPGAGGANHRYSITGFDTANNPSNEDSQGYRASFSRQVILFQNGPINEVGVNGITHEALLVILIDRLRCFQSGPYNCFENACALTYLEAAQASLHSRTRARMDRGVEGTHQK
jgi:hypothetical protein